jgi:hypothetical protein
MDIKKAIEIVHKDSLLKKNTCIPVLIQEMVDNPDYAGTLFGIDIRNDNDDYYTLNYVNGL